MMIDKITIESRKGVVLDDIKKCDEELIKVQKITAQLTKKKFELEGAVGELNNLLRLLDNKDNGK